MTIPKIWALVPIKAFTRAKQRLAPSLDAAQRAALAAQMASQVLDALKAEHRIFGIAVVSSDRDVLRWAVRRGAATILEKREGLNAALEQGAEVLADIGATTLLVLPGDLPLIKASDLRDLMSRVDGPGVVVVPSGRDGGTNALLLTPPRALRFAFGHNSAHRHIAAARSSGLSVATLELQSFSRDIDMPADLAYLSDNLSAAIDRERA